MRLRLSHLLPTLPRYSNNKTKGEYKNGNYKGIFLAIGNGIYRRVLVDEDIPKEYFERPWYVSQIIPKCTSAYGSKGNAGLFIIVDKEENKYE